MKSIYAIGDIHGDITMFHRALADYDFSSHQLVLLGDLLDRGSYSKECLLLGQQLVKKQQAIYLKGNHEDLLLRFIEDPIERYPNYLLNGGKATIESLLHPGACEEYSAVEIASMIRHHYKELLAFLGELPLYYEWGPYVFVHAGVDLTKENLQQTSARDFVWIREPFHQLPNQTGKTIVFGHTPTPNLYGDNQTTKLWQVDHKIGMDGGGIYGGSVHAVIFDERGIVQDQEFFQGEVWQPEG
ncbi:metallophosphoesterase family protein [Vagococcus zengguangii]|uniref:Serine/threonine protein phosphatase n=1 Tax=Vagococcus zengguangii TaxID=2571750 RepID=A0A4D7CU57_9ENTE|nr:metallophosphoesterase family protein [Vagococcus zengguangii]QCI86823.1 serine/threonine protein phosphatase [Vagococcus zengguangii]TLG80429.1 serine/threonine protein phosphatase [Vagococcus zengguangii]